MKNKKPTPPAQSAPMVKIFIQGIVQGVGFRPYIYRKAHQHNLVGYVKNIGHGVELVINDPTFMDKLTDLPPLAKITEYTISKVTSTYLPQAFTIKKSTTSTGETTLPADIFTCKDCLEELSDASNRRHKYYFITCTNCGPRFSMIEDYPYDRPLTSMHEFTMCPACHTEYTNPLDRRYHAQTIACKECGPKLHLLEKSTDISESTDLDTIKKAIHLIKKGHSIAIKGVGGFHICSLSDNDSVHNVRTLLNRPHKPFALMVKDLAMATRYATIGPIEQQVLQGPVRPIVVVQKNHRQDFSMVSELASIGVMLPYTALHYLLFDFIDEPLLMTSCNIPGEPVAITEHIGDYFLTHDRRIVNRCDDSVQKIINNTTFYLRRSRGYTPLPVKLPISCQDTIAVGAELNNVICAVKKNNCYLSQYIGETSKYETFAFLKEAIDTFINLTRLQPKIIACDLHPTYNSTLYAKELAKRYNATVVPIQHHQAHVASVAAEHTLDDYVGIGIDGLGFGEDESIWGGEIFDVSDQTTFKRIGHLEPQPQLGGDSATLYPKKMLFGILSKIYSHEELSNMRLFPDKETTLYLNQLHEQFNTPFSSSAGRILDAAAAFLDYCDQRTYDGRPAMILESMATKPYDFPPIVHKINGISVLSTTDLFKFLLEHSDKDKRRLAATVQMYLAQGLYQIASTQKDKPIVASGGVCYNSMISSYLIEKGVLFNKEIPSGDGGICYGQAYLANSRYNSS